MKYKTHQFDDNIGGSFKYMDQPDRLSDLLKKDSNLKHRKSIHTPDLDIKAHADWYVNHVLATRSKDLVFWPIKKGGLNSHSNKFQFEVLVRLTNTGYLYACSLGLPYLRDAAIKAGYTLTEYSED